MGEPDVIARARASGGHSDAAVHAAVARAIAGRAGTGGTLVDVGCGVGALWRDVRSAFDACIGLDAVRYDGLPDDVVFHEVDLNAARWPLDDALGDVVAAVETIEHLENPRSFLREVARLCRPGGLIVVTTPNQVSFLSKLTLALRNEFSAFRDGSYPAHITALLPIDLVRIGSECGLVDLRVRYSGSGRMPGTSAHYPRWCSRLLPRALSDNVLLLARRPPS